MPVINAFFISFSFRKQPLELFQNYVMVHLLSTIAIFFLKYPSLCRQLVFFQCLTSPHRSQPEDVVGILQPIP
jgi:hypothetical protein